MAYITEANLKNVVYNSEIFEMDLEGEVYHKPIYFFSKYEESELLAIQELLKDPENYFYEIYKPIKNKDTYTYIYEGKKPAYHKHLDCPRLKSDYQNFLIPDQIKEKGPETVNEFRKWFETVKYLLDRPKVFVMRLQARWGIITSPSEINKDNSGTVEIENLTIEELESRIDNLIKEAGRFYYQNEKNTKILKKFSKFTFLAFSKKPIKDNNTGYSDEEVKQFLKAYDDKFKKPIKKYLIEYYRIKLNPEIELEGYLLENLGFKSCSHCHSDKYYQHKNSIEVNQLVTV